MPDDGRHPLDALIDEAAASLTSGEPSGALRARVSARIGKRPRGWSIGILSAGGSSRAWPVSIRTFAVATALVVAIAAGALLTRLPHGTDTGRAATEPAPLVAPESTGVSSAGPNASDPSRRRGEATDGAPATQALGPRQPRPTARPEPALARQPAAVAAADATPAIEPLEVPSLEIMRIAIDASGLMPLTVDEMQVELLQIQ